MKVYLRSLNDDQRIQIIEMKKRVIIQNFQILRNNFFVSTTRKSYVVIIFVFQFITSIIIVFSNSIINIFVTFTLNRSNDVSRILCFICYKINHFIIDYFDNLSKNVRVNDIKFKNFNNENSKNV